MAGRRSLSTLTTGVILIGVGVFFFLYQVMDWDISVIEILRLIIPAFFLWIGLTKLVRHYTWDPQEAANNADKTSLLGGLFFTFLGTVIALDFLWEYDFLPLFAFYWPLVIVTFGLGKIIDYFRLGTAMRFRGGEIFGIIVLIFIGLSARTIDDAHWNLLPPFLERDDRWERAPRWQEAYSVDLEGATSIHVANLYGDVRISGGEGQEGVRVELVKIVNESRRSEAREVADRIRLQSEVSEGVLRISTNRSSVSSNLRFRTDMVITLPDDMPLQAVNGYGYLRASRMKAPVKLENNRGEVVAEFIDGSVDITSRREPVLVRRINGDLTVSNERGSVHAEDVTGLVQLSTQHEEIRAQSVDGDMRLSNYHGSVRLNDIEGIVEIDAVGSQVSLSDISSDVTVSNSYKDFEARALGGTLRLSTNNCDSVRLNEIAGLVEIDGRHFDILAEDLQGGLTVRGESIGLQAERINGPLVAHTSLRDISIEEVPGPLDVQNTNGDIRVGARTPLRGAFLVENSNGALVLEIPRQAAFNLTAQTQGAKIESDFGNIEESDEALRFSQGEGGVEIRLQNRFAGIRIKAVG
ncbi:MAG TPA: DUF4097 family beta strand repeat-containing protein [Acidobacteriota bacterium]|nr:DUF4097 family beta strand repeat-containing protein [Acidobacteriota bacterium]